MEINEIKNRLSILTVLAKYNLKPNKNNLLNCPFHNDKTASLQIYPKTNSFYCFACGATGDQIEFIEKYEKLDKHQAILKAKSMIGKTEAKQSEQTQNFASQTASKEQPNYEELFLQFKQSLLRSTKAQEYLKQRSLEGFKEVGYNSGKFYNKLKYCIIFPLKDKSGKITSLYGRRITEAKAYTVEVGKHYYSENRTGLYPCYPNAKTEVLIITEAIIDAVTLLQIPEITSQFTILSAYGTNGLTKEHKSAIAELKNLQEIIFFFDGDQAGKEGITKYSEELKDLNCKITAVETPENEPASRTGWDVNSMFVTYGKDAILQLIAERKSCEVFASQTSQDEPEDEKQLRKFLSSIEKENFANPIPELDTSIPNKIIFETETARYIVKGGLPKQLDKMLVSLDVQHLETGLKYRCRLDLYEEKQTRKEAREAAEKLDLRSDLIETDLSKLTDLLEEYRDLQLETKPEGHSKKEKPVSPEWQARCLRLLKSQTLLKDLQTTIRQAGVIGEEKNIMMLFLSAFSYKMPETLHVIIQGSSGSGKTTLLSKTASFMPPERVIKFTRVTEGSFYNYDEYFFVGMFIGFEDLDGLKFEALLAVRELISNEILVSSTTWKDENGNMSGKPKTVRGPMASVSATTNGQLYEDNESRVFIIAVDESMEQTKRIVDYQQKKSANIIDESKEKEATELLQNTVRMLKPYKVLNPFADKVQLPEETDKLRRLSKLFLALVKQVTLLHQYQRKQTTDGKLITTKEDVKNAIEILFDTIVLKIDELDGSLRQFFEQLKSWVKKQGVKPESFEFMRRDVRQALHIKPTRLHYYFEKLAELEYIGQSGGYNNRGLKYKIIWWDDYQAFRSRIKNHLLSQLENLTDAS